MWQSITKVFFFFLFFFLEDEEHIKRAKWFQIKPMQNCFLKIWNFKGKFYHWKKMNRKGIWRKLSLYTLCGRTQEPMLWNWCRQLLESIGRRQRELSSLPLLSLYNVVVRLKWQVCLHVISLEVSGKISVSKWLDALRKGGRLLKWLEDVILWRFLPVDHLFCSET